MTCPECQWDYPDTILNSLFLNGEYTEPMCGICALRIVNAFVGIKRETFGGDEAEHMRRSALDWRRVHPELNPKKKPD